MTLGPKSPHSHNIHRISWLGQAEGSNLSKELKTGSEALMQRIQSAAKESFKSLHDTLSSKYDIDIRQTPDGEGFKIYHQDSHKLIADISRVADAPLATLIQDLWDLHSPKAPSRQAAEPVMGSSIMMGGVEALASSRVTKDLVSSEKQDLETLIEEFRAGRLEDHSRLSPYLDSGHFQTLHGLSRPLSATFLPDEYPFIEESSNFYLDLHLLEDIRRCLESGLYKEAAVSYQLLTPDVKQLLNRRLHLNAPSVLPFALSTHVKPLNELAQLLQKQTSSSRLPVTLGQIYSLKAELIADKKTRAQSALMYEIIRRNDADQEALIRENEGLRASLAEMEEGLSASEGALAHFSSTLSSKESELSGLREMIDLLRAEKKAFEDENAASRVGMRGYEIALETLKAQLSSVQELLTQTQASLATLGSENSSLRDELEEKIASLAKKEKTLAAAISENELRAQVEAAKIAGLEKILGEQTVLIGDLSGKLRAKEEAFQALALTHEALQAEHLKTQARLRETEDLLRASSLEVEGLKKELELVRKEHVKTTSLLLGMGEDNAALKRELQIKVEALEAQVARLSMALEESSQRAHEASVTIATLQKDLTKQSTLNSTLTDQLAAARGELEASQKAFSALSLSKDEIVSSLEATIRDKEEELARQAARHGEIVTRASASFEDVNAQLIKALEDLDAKSRLLEELRASNVSLEESNRELSTLKESLNRSLEEALSSLKVRTEAVDLSEEEKRLLGERVSSLEEVLLSKDQDLSALRSAFEEAKAEIRKLKARAENFELDQEAKTALVAQLKGDLERLSSVDVHLRGELNKIAASLFRGTPIEDSQDVLITRVQQQIEALQLQNSAQRSLIEETSLAKAELERRLIDLKAKASADKKALEEALAGVESSKRDEIAALSQTITQLRGELRAAREAQEALQQAQAASLKDHLAQKAALDKASADLIAQEALIASLRSELSLLQSTHADLQRDKKDKEAHLTKTQADLQKALGVLVASQSSLAALQQTYDETLASLQATQKLLIDKQLAFNEEQSRDKALISTLEVSLVELQANTRSDRTLIEALQEDIAKKVAGSQKAKQSYDEDISALRQQLSVLEAAFTEEKRAMKEALEALGFEHESAIGTKERALQEALSQQLKSQGEAARLNQELEALKEVLKARQSELLTRGEELRKAQGALTAFEAEGLRLSAQLEALELHQKALEERASSQEGLLSEARSEIAKQGTLITKLQTSLASTGASREALEVCLKATLKEIAVLTKTPLQEDLIESSAHQLEALKALIETNERRRASLEGSLQEMSLVVTDKTRRLAELDLKLSLIEERERAQGILIAGLTSQKSDISAELERERALCLSLQESLASEKQQSRLALDTLQSRLELAEAQLRESQSENRALQAEHDKALALIASLRQSARDEHRDHQLRVQTLQEELTALKAQHTEATGALKAQLREQRERLQEFERDIETKKEAFRLEKEALVFSHARAVDDLQAQHESVIASSRALSEKALRDLEASQQTSIKLLIGIQHKKLEDLEASQRAALSAKELELSARSLALSSAQSRIEALEDEMRALQTELTQNEAKIRALEASNRELVAQSQDLSDKLRISQEALGLKEKQLVKIQSALAEKQALFDTMQEVQSETVFEARRSLATMLSSCAPLKSEIEGLAPLLDSLENLDEIPVTELLSKAAPLGAIMASYSGALRDAVITKKAEVEMVLARLSEATDQKLHAQRELEALLHEMGSCQKELAALREALGQQTAVSEALKAEKATLQIALAGGAREAKERERMMKQLQDLYKSRTDMIRVLLDSAMPVSDFGFFARLAENYRPTLIESLSAGLPSEDIHAAFASKDIRGRLDNITLSLTLLSLPFAGDRGTPLRSINLTGFMNVTKASTGTEVFELNIPDNPRWPAEIEKAVKALAVSKFGKEGADFYIQEAKKALRSLFPDTKSKAMGGSGGIKGGGGASPRSFSPVKKGAEEEMGALETVYGAGDVGLEKVAQVFDLAKGTMKPITVASATSAQGMAIKATLPASLNKLFTSLLSKEQMNEILSQKYARELDIHSNDTLRALLDPSMRDVVLTAIDIKMNRHDNYFQGDQAHLQPLVDQLADEFIRLNRFKLLQALAEGPNLALDLCGWRIRMGTSMKVFETPVMSELNDAIKQGFDLLKPLLEQLFLATVSA